MLKNVRTGYSLNTYVVEFVGSRLAPSVFLCVLGLSSLNFEKQHYKFLLDQDRGPLENQLRLMWLHLSILQFLYLTETKEFIPKTP